jgi:hypothetical protein
MYKKGVGTWWRRNLSGTVSVTWRSVPGGRRRRAQFVLTVVPVGPGLCWLFGLSGRTWTLRVPSAPVGPGCCRLFLFRGEGKEGGREAAGVPSQWEGTGQEEKGEREGRGSLAMGGNGPGRKGRAGRPGFPRNGRERARKTGKAGKKKKKKKGARGHVYCTDCAKLGAISTAI